MKAKVDAKIWEFVAERVVSEASNHVEQPKRPSNNCGARALEQLALAER